MAEKHQIFCDIIAINIQAPKSSQIDFLYLLFV